MDYSGSDGWNQPLNLLKSPDGHVVYLCPDLCFFLLATYIVLTWQVINGGIPFINPSFSPQSFFCWPLWAHPEFNLLP